MAASQDCFEAHVLEDWEMISHLALWSLQPSTVNVITAAAIISIAFQIQQFGFPIAEVIGLDCGVFETPGCLLIARRYILAVGKRSTRSSPKLTNSARPINAQS